MVHLSEPGNYQKELFELPRLVDPGVLRAARLIYRNYNQKRFKLPKSPLGVAIHQKTHHGHLLFHRKPILLPGECFIPLNQLEAEVF